MRAPGGRGCSGGAQGQKNERRTLQQQQAEGTSTKKVNERQEGEGEGSSQWRRVSGVCGRARNLQDKKVGEVSPRLGATRQPPPLLVMAPDQPQELAEFG